MKPTAFLLFTLAATFAGPVTAQDAPPPAQETGWKPAIGQPAPEPALSTWVDEEAPAKGTKRVVSSGAMGELPTSRRANTLAELSDHVVIVYTFAWDDLGAREKSLPLVRDLLAANADRKISAIGIANEMEREAARSNAKSLGLDHPIALEKSEESKSPYVDPAAHGVAFVVGRGGGLLWRGNLAQEEKAFLSAVHDALDVVPVQRIERPLHDALSKALGEYYAGRLSKAASLAQDQREAAGKSGDQVLAADAQLLERLSKATQLQWLKELGDAAAKKDATAYVALARACKQGFAKGDIGKELERLDKAAHKDGFFDNRVMESQKYLDLLADRPVLFPARKEPAGEKFASKLESFVRSTPNSTEETRTAKALADRYRLTAH